MRITIPFIGALVNSALYLTGCFVAGLLVDSSWAWKCALAGMGVAFLGYVAAEMSSRFAVPLVLASWALGVVAGLILLFA